MMNKCVYNVEKGICVVKNDDVHDLMMVVGVGVDWKNVFEDVDGDNRLGWHG